MKENKTVLVEIAQSSFAMAHNVNGSGKEFKVAEPSTATLVLAGKCGEMVSLELKKRLTPVFLFEPDRHSRNRTKVHVVFASDFLYAH